MISGRDTGRVRDAPNARRVIAVPSSSSSSSSLSSPLPSLPSPSLSLSSSLIVFYTGKQCDTTQFPVVIIVVLAIVCLGVVVIGVLAGLWLRKSPKTDGYEPIQ